MAPDSTPQPKKKMRLPKKRIVKKRSAEEEAAQRKAAFEIVGDVGEKDDQIIIAGLKAKGWSDEDAARIVRTAKSGLQAATRQMKRDRVSSAKKIASASGGSMAAGITFLILGFNMEAELFLWKGGAFLLFGVLGLIGALLVAMSSWWAKV